jgi:hypothetical protein
LPKTVEPDRFRNCFKTPQIPRSDFKKTQTPLKKAEVARDDLMKFRFFIYKVDFEGYFKYGKTLFKKLENIIENGVYLYLPYPNLPTKSLRNIVMMAIFYLALIYPLRIFETVSPRSKLLRGDITKINLEVDFKNKPKIQNTAI